MTLRRAVVIGGVLTLVTLAVGGLAGATPRCMTGTIIDLEVARTTERAVDLIGRCDTAGLDVLRTGLRVDSLGFAPLYAVSLAYWCVLAARRLSWSTDWRRRAVVVGAALAPAAFAFDLVENHQLMHVVTPAGPARRSARPPRRAR